MRICEEFTPTQSKASHVCNLLQIILLTSRLSRDPLFYSRSVKELTLAVTFGFWIESQFFQVCPKTIVICPYVHIKLEQVWFVVIIPPVNTGQ